MRRQKQQARGASGQVGACGCDSAGEMQDAPITIHFHGVPGSPRQLTLFGGAGGAAGGLLALHQRIEHALDLGNRTVPVVEFGCVGKAHRAGEVARAVDLDDRQTRMLFVIGAQPAIERAPGFGAGLRRPPPMPRFAGARSAIIAIQLQYVNLARHLAFTL